MAHGIVAVMNKRILAASLWLFAGWYIGAAVAVFVGLPELIGLIPGLAMAGLVAADPTRRLWTPTAELDYRS
ncbi:MAG: hypothetical protein WD116_04350 [Chloroflexota bacterium]